MGALLVNPDRLGNWVGLGDFEIDSPEDKRATEVIITISDLVRGEAKQPTWDLDTVPPEVAAITLMVAVECWSNPDNKSSVTIEEITRRWENGDLFSRSQLDTLRSHRPNKPTGLGTVAFTRGLDSQSIAVGRTMPHIPRPSGSSVAGEVAGGSPVILYDGRGF